MDSSKKIMEILIATETLADEILQKRQEIIALDKRRQGIRESLRTIKNLNEDKVFLTIGDTLIKTKRELAIQLLEKDQFQIDVDINKLRSDQKLLVTNHRDLEYKLMPAGYNLQPLNRDDIQAFRSNKIL